MNIKDSRTCNILSLKLIAEYYGADFRKLEGYYWELLADKKFLRELNRRIKVCRPLYPKGIFSGKSIDTADWFGNERIALYVLIRLLRPKVVVETGVFYGGTTAFILNALRKNKAGKLISIDLSGNVLEKISFHRHEKVGRSEIIPEGLSTGFIVPDYLKDRWQFVEENSMKALKRIKKRFSFFVHDSEHSMAYMFKELELAKSRMSKNGTLFADDMDWSNGFYKFCVKNKLYPLFLTDNGKNELKVRLGLVRLNHSYNRKKDVTI